MSRLRISRHRIGSQAFVYKLIWDVWISSNYKQPIGFYLYFFMFNCCNDSFAEILTLFFFSIHHMGLSKIEFLRLWHLIWPQHRIWLTDSMSIPKRQEMTFTRISWSKILIFPYASYKVWVWHEKMAFI